VKSIIIDDDDDDDSEQSSRYNSDGRKVYVDFAGNTGNCESFR